MLVPGITHQDWHRAAVKVLYKTGNDEEKMSSYSCALENRKPNARFRVFTIGLIADQLKVRPAGVSCSGPTGTAARIGCRTKKVSTWWGTVVGHVDAAKKCTT